MAGGQGQSSSSSGIFFQGDRQAQGGPGSSHLNSGFGNSSNSISGIGRGSLGTAAGEMHRVLNSAGNSGPSVGASSLVTDANSALSGGAHLQRSASFNTDSYMRLPASPLSFSSNNISISGSSVIDGSSIAQQSGSSITRLESHRDQSSQLMQQRQQQGASGATSQPTMQQSHHQQIMSQTSQVPAASLRSGQQLTGQGLAAMNQDTENLSMQQNQMQKPRLDMRQDDILQQQVIQQLLQRPDSGLLAMQLQRQDSLQLQGHNPQLQALLQQHRLMQRHQQQQQFLQSMPQMQRSHMQQQHPQLRHPLQPQSVQPVPAMKRPYDSGICARRLMQYMYHQRQRPADNTILYWRKFVAEYFAPRAKKRWCLSLYENVGHHALGVFPQAAMDVWQCDICGSKSGRGFETTVEVLPRLNKIKFDSGVVDELLFVDMPNECRFPSGIMMLEYGKAIQESVYEQLRVVREGQLRILFTPELKILSWEFCARRHEELLPRRLVAPQVNQLVQVAQKYQSAAAEGGSSGISTTDLQTNCNMFVSAGRQLARVLELQSLNDLGFSKRYIRCLQISEVVNSMKDLIDFSREHNVGPIASLKNYPRQAAMPKLQMQKMQEMEQLANAQGPSTDQNSLNKMMAMHSGIGTHMNNSQNIGSGVLSGSPQTAVALSNYQNLLRQNSMNSSNQNALQQDPTCSFGGSNQPAPSQSMPFQNPVAPLPGSLQNPSSVNGLPSPHVHQANLAQQNHSQPPQVSQQLQQHVIQQLLQEMMSNNSNSNNNGGGSHQCLSVQSANNSVAEEMLNGLNTARSGASMPGNGSGFRNNATNMSNNVMGMIPSRSNSFKNISSNAAVVGGNTFGLRSDMPQQDLHLQDMVQDIPNGFTENGMFNGESSDMGYGWKG